MGDLPEIVEKYCIISTKKLKDIFKLQILNCVIKLPKLTSKQALKYYTLCIGEHLQVKNVLKSQQKN